MSQLTTPNDANLLGNVFGGSLMAMIDLCAYTTASRFAGVPCVTASFDRVDFHQPINVGELVTLTGTVTYVGRTSVEVTIDVVAEDVFSREGRSTNTARVTMVAIRDGKPSPVPRLICETREDKIRFLAGRIRRQRRDLHRQEFEALLDELEASTDAELDARLRE
jgi:acyl-CoA hydrolase